ncbi:hypothetical protein P171DRAFT_444802 [Karstenula rhodostoma CBS 690.94]|uniref:Uncharacterized protein n=1 Tax=Karstenula rhodostoma CBS 690.94 TaxID=1392251 RepID=A0A9P4PI34_9PLEO|nr:hypothetical protein P171DRAFT_444802 [Karstenula rhodostoma CBS 690.94]
MTDPDAPLHPQFIHPKCATYHLPPPGTPLTEYGLVHGGAIITMAETLSRSDAESNWVLSRLLQSTYIDPFIRIDRNDAIVIPTATHMERLTQIHKRYKHVCSLSHNSALEMLWVPGFEPSYEGNPAIEDLDGLEVPGGLRKAVFDGADMYERSGKRRGVVFGEVRDRGGWGRRLWDLPRGEMEGTPEEIPSEWVTQVTCQKDMESGRLVLKNVRVGPKVSAAGLMRVNVEGVEIRFVEVWSAENGEGVSAEKVKGASAEDVEGASARAVEGANAVDYAGDPEKMIKQEEGSTVVGDSVE